MDRIRIAFLGTGSIAGKHLHPLADHDEVEIVAGCDVRQGVVRDFFRNVLKQDPRAETLPTFDDARTMYRQTAPDAVVICTPHTLHFDHAMQALDHGCHVLLEKPMVTDLDDAYRLRDRVRETGQVLLVAYNTPCTPEFRYLRDVIREGSLGVLQVVSGFISQNWRGGAKGKWRQNPRLSGGGMCYDTGAHLLNSICWAVESPITEVHAYVDNMDTEVDINTVFVCRFDNGVMASVAVAGDSPDWKSDAQFLFSEGRIGVDGWSGHWIDVHKHHYRVKYPPITAPPYDPAHNFIDAVRGRHGPLASVEQGVIHSQLMDAIYESARTGKPARPRHA